MRQVLINELCNEKPNAQALGAFNAAVSNTANAYISYAKENNSVLTLKVISRGIKNSKFGTKSEAIGNKVAGRLRAYLKDFDMGKK